MTQCSRHISWLELEQHRLGELKSDRFTHVLGHLGVCSQCRASLAAIETDRVELLPLPQKLVVSRRKPVKIFRPGWAFAAAAALLLCVSGIVVAVKLSAPDSTDRGAYPAGIKGGDVTVVLVAKTEKGIGENPRSFHEGDVFRVEVTTGESGAFSLFAVQGGEVFVLVDEPVSLEAGNRKHLPGAHRLSGDEPVTFCVTERDLQELSGLQPGDFMSARGVFCAETVYPALEKRPK